MSSIEGAIERADLVKVEKGTPPPKKSKAKLSFFEGAEKYFCVDIGKSDEQLRILNAYSQIVFWGIPSYVFEIIYNSSYSENTISFLGYLNLAAILSGTFQYVKTKREMSSPDVDAKISKILEKFFEEGLLFLEEDESLFFAVNKAGVSSTNMLVNFQAFTAFLGYMFGLNNTLKKCIMHYDDPAILWFFVLGASLYALGLIYLYQSLFSEIQYIKECIKENLNKQRKEIISTIEELTSGVLNMIPEINEDLEPNRIFNYVRVSFQKNTKWEDNKNFHRLSLTSLNKELLFILGLIGIHGYLERKGRDVALIFIDGRVQKVNPISLEKTKEIFYQRLKCRASVDAYCPPKRNHNFIKLLGHLNKITKTIWYISKTTQDDNTMRLCFSSKESHLSREVKDFFIKFCHKNPAASIETEPEGTYNFYCSDIKTFLDEVKLHLQPKSKPEPHFKFIQPATTCLLSEKQAEKKKIKTKSPSSVAQHLSSDVYSGERHITCDTNDSVHRDITIGDGNNRRHFNLRFENLQAITSNKALDDIAIKKIMSLLREGDFLSSASKGRPGLKVHKGGLLRLKLKGYMGNCRLRFMRRPSDPKEEPGTRVYEYQGIEMKKG